MTSDPSSRERALPWRFPFLPPVLALLALGGCSEEPAAGTNGAGSPQQRPAGPANGLALQPWHGDFPFEVHLSPRTVGQWYGRTRRQALAKVVANLEGACTADAWRFAKLFFDAAPPGSAELLTAAADANSLAASRASYLENLAEAMGRARDPELAPVLLRLLEHDSLAVRSKGMSGLVNSGTPEAVLTAERAIDKVNGRARGDWLRAVARRVPDPVPVFERWLEAPESGKFVVSIVMEEALTMPRETGVRIADLVISARRAPPDVLFVAASILHGAGDTRGSSLLREMLRGDDPTLKAGAVRSAAKGDLGILLEDILRLVDYEDPEVRLAVAEVLAPLPGENVDDILTTMGADVAAPVRQLALRALAQRGKRYHLDQLIDRVRTGTGMNLMQAMQDVSASGDPAALAAVYERFQQAPAEEQRPYLQALAYSRRIEVFPYLREVFLGEERVLGASGLTTVGNAAMLMANLEGVVPDLLALYAELPRPDYRRRAHLLYAAGNVAGVATDPADAAPVVDLFARVRADRSEIPQLRLLALQFARRHLTLDDAMAMKAALADEPEPMRWAFNDFLFEFF